MEGQGRQGGNNEEMYFTPTVTILPCDCHVVIRAFHSELKQVLCIMEPGCGLYYLLDDEVSIHFANLEVLKIY